MILDDLLSIGQFAELSGLTVKALRLYDRCGLLRPRTVDLSSGYRYYGPDQARLARRIRALRLLHMPLAEIRALLGAGEPQAMDECLKRHRRRLAQRQADYARALQTWPTLEQWIEVLHEEERMSNTETEKTYRCSFCGKVNTDVGRMIAGPGAVYICNECVALCNEIIAREELQEEQAKA